jgi:tyrosyl-tRNA synthetase
MYDFISELTWRGMVHDAMPGTAQRLSSGPTAGYIGFDPTATSLHVGNLATLMLLVHFQRAGHLPIALVGGATGMIGDPSGKSKERQFLSEDTLRANQEAIRLQLVKFLDFSGSNAAQVVNNYDWFRELGFLDFLRNVGKHLTLNYMMSKESVKSRLGEGHEGISFTEFSYQLLQGYDFYWLWKHKGVSLQMGGSDQWGNITTGTELIRRMEGGEAFALTTPLITKSDGSKFGKSEGGNVWLDPALTSPYKFYQFWLKVGDAEVPRLIRVFTLLDKASIEELEASHAQDPGKRVLQKALAKELTMLVHSLTEYEKAVEASDILFGKSTTQVLNRIDEATLLEVFEGLPMVNFSKDEWSGLPNVLEFVHALAEKQRAQGHQALFQSKGDARKLITGNGVSINKIKVSDPVQVLDFELLQGKYLLVQKGKDYCLALIKS